jgi:hypothetical protein
MKKTFRINLGSADAKTFGLDWTKCHAGDSVDLSADQVKAMTDKYPALFVDPSEESVKGVAQTAEITAPAKAADKHGK